MVISAPSLPSLEMWCVHDVHSLEGQRPEAAAVILGRSLQYVQVQIATAKFLKNLGEERFATYPTTHSQTRQARQTRIETGPF